MADYKLGRNAIIRNTDNAVIPYALGNKDYADYLKWLDAGNTPDPQDPDPAPQGPPIDALILAELKKITANTQKV